MNNLKPINSTTLPKLVGEIRHYPPAIKEWKNSVYAYNKSFIRSLPSKDIMASRLIKNYFNLGDSKHLARSKRMRSLIRKSSANRLFISKPEFKQTNDNVAITIYALDNEKQILLKKIFHNLRKWENKINVRGLSYINTFNSYDHWRNRYNFYKSLNKLENNVLNIYTNNNSSEAKLIKNKYLSLKTKYLLSINRIHTLKTRSNIYVFNKHRKNTLFKSILLRKKKKSIRNKNMPYLGIRSLNEAKFLRYISQFKSNSIQARKYVYYSYLKRILFLFGIKVLSFDKINNIISQDDKDTEIIQYMHNLNHLRDKGKMLLFFKGLPLSKPLILSINNIQNNLSYLDKVNLVLSNFVKKLLHNNNFRNISFVDYSKINFKEFLLKEYMETYTPFSKKGNTTQSTRTKLDFLKKEISLIKNYINVKINKFKFGKYLSALKLLIGKIYNKNVQLNIIKHKYMYLNSDIYTEAISMKLKRKIGMLQVIKKSLMLVKIPAEFSDKTGKFNNMSDLDIYKSLKLDNLYTSNTINNKDSLDIIIKNLYPSSLINIQKNNVIHNTKTNIQLSKKTIGYSADKIMDIINEVKYKWVTGVRLEAAGRLTRRYTASRSVYKYKYKGSLKNTDFSRKLDFLKKSMPVIMHRNIAKTNSQYTFTKSKRRIGAFGVKGWISSY